MELPWQPNSSGSTSTEEELRQSRAFLDSIIENIPNMVFVKEAKELRFVRFNRAGEDLVGYTRDELIGKNDFDLFPHEDAVSFTSKDREVLASGHVTDIPTEPLQTRSKGRRILHTQKIPILGPDGEAEYLLGISEDVTERVHSEEVLRARQQTLDAVFDASPDAIMILNQDGSIEELSAGIEHIDGIPATEHTRQGLLESVHADDLELVQAGLNWLVSSPTQTIEVRYRLRHASGHWVPVEARGRALLDRDGLAGGLLLVIRDISAQVAGEEALAAARLEAERANQAKNEFLSRMSHELRTPLNAILGFAQVLDMELDDESDLECVHHILGGGRHLLELINEILDISRIDAGLLTISLESVDLGELLHECLTLMSPQAATRDIELINLDGTDLHVRADRHRLSQVFLNLLSNAIKFNRDGGSVTVDGFKVDGLARVTVTDTGPGIAPELIERIFRPFDRLGAEITGVEGTGLGMAVSHRLCEAMGITLGLNSVVGQGSTFWIEVPVEELPLPPEPVDPTTTTSQQVQSSGTVLHIEDNLANQLLVEHLLHRRPAIRLIDALQGSLGLELAAQHHPDLILLDVHLPDLPGEVVLLRLRADPRTADIPVIIVSADATTSQIETFRNAGAVDYLTKPLDVHDLLDAIDRTITR